MIPTERLISWQDALERGQASLPAAQSLPLLAELLARRSGTSTPSRELAGAQRSADVWRAEASAARDREQEVRRAVRESAKRSPDMPTISAWCADALSCIAEWQCDATDPTVADHLAELIAQAEEWLRSIASLRLH